MWGHDKIFPVREERTRVIKEVLVLFSVLTLASLIAINLVETQWVLLFDVAVMAFYFCWRFTTLAFYAMVFLYPFINWQFQYADLNVPLVDGLAVFVFAAWLIRKLLALKTSPLSLRDFPGLLFAACFFVAGALSIVNADYPVFALKYLARPIVFFYFMYLVLPYGLILKKRQLKPIFRIIFVVGIFVALMGLLSMVFSSGPWYTKRALPFSFGNFSPLGGNQNAIAEVLIVAIPITLALFAWAKRYRTQAILLIGSGLMMGVLLLTFSRAGWLALLLQMLILLFFRYRKRLHAGMVIGALITFIVIPMLLYFTVWQDISWVRESNSNRLLLTGIAWNSFLAHPVIGNGVNSFQQLVGETFVFTVEFGDPLDSHGFIQKIATEQGVLGLAAFLGLLVYIFRQYIRAFLRERDEKERFVLICLIMMVSGTVLFQLFSTSYYISRMWLPIGVGLAAARLYRD